MTKTFDTYTEMLGLIADEIMDRVPGSRYGRSERSMSTYVSVEGRDGEYKVRMSDHSAKASCGGKIVAELMVGDLLVEEIYDDCGEFESIEAGNWAVAEAFIETAVSALSKVETDND